MLVFYVLNPHSQGSKGKWVVRIVNHYSDIQHLPEQEAVWSQIWCQQEVIAHHVWKMWMHWQLQICDLSYSTYLADIWCVQTETSDTAVSFTCLMISMMCMKWTFIIRKSKLKKKVWKISYTLEAIKLYITHYILITNFCALIVIYS